MTLRWGNGLLLVRLLVVQKIIKLLEMSYNRTHPTKAVNKRIAASYCSKFMSRKSELEPMLRHEILDRLLSAELLCRYR